MNALQKIAVCDVPPGQAAAALHTDLYALYTDTPDTLLFLCRLLRARGYSGKSDAYTLPGTPPRFFLAVSESGHRGPTAPTAILDEYGTRIASDTLIPYLREHGTCLVEENAVEQLAAL